MKNSVILKSMLALSILATGVSTYGEISQIEAKQAIEQSEQDLKAYYSKNPISTIATIEEMSGNNWELTFNIGSQILSANVKTNRTGFTEGEKVYAFIVPEGTSKQAQIQSIGGISKNKPEKRTLNIKINGQTNEKQRTATNMNESLEISNGEISLKELDFRIRKILIDSHGLYTTYNSGTIVVRTGTKEKDKYTFELGKKLQEHRMDDTIQSKDITSVTVDLKKS